MVAVTRAVRRAELRVQLSAAPGVKTARPATDPGSRARLVQLVEFYKSRGFVLLCPDAGDEAEELVLSPPAGPAPA